MERKEIAGATRARAFTLIELLVVIAIIAILAAILFPVFARSRAKGLQMQCLSNMKQVGLALLMYRQDFNGTWVPVALPDKSAKPPNSTYWQPFKLWIGFDTSPQKPRFAGYDGREGDMTQPAYNPDHPGMIDVYIKDHNVKACPVRPSGAQMIYAGNCWGREWGWPAQHNEFGPFCKDNYGLTSGANRGASESDIEQESNTMVVWEHWYALPWCNFIQDDGQWFDTPPQDDYHRYHFSWLHYEGANTLWADGHAKRVLYDQLKRWMFGCHKGIYPNFQ